MGHELKAEFVASMFRGIYADHELTSDNVEQAIANNVFAVTIKFEGVSLRGSARDPDTYLSHNRLWFRWLMQQTLRNNLGRKMHAQPICFSFVDFPGSRGMLIGERIVDPLKCGLLHIHSVLGLRAGLGQIVREPLLLAGSADQISRFGQVKVEAFNPTKGSLENLIAYSKKGADLLGSFHRSDCYDLLPH